MIAVVNVFYPPQAIGGATRMVHDNIADLQAQFGDAFDLCVICTCEGAPASEISAYMHDDIPVWAIGSPDQKGTEMTPRDPRMAEVFGRILDQLSPDLVHFHCIQRLTSSVVDATRKRNIPYLITVHDGWWISARQFLLDPVTDTLDLYDYAKLRAPDTPPRAASLWPALSGARQVLAVSDAFADLHRKCHVPNVITVENGVSRVPDVTRQPHPKGRVRLAHIGGTERHKGLPILRNALVARDYHHLELLVIDHALAPGVVEQDIWGNTPVTRQGKLPQSEVDALYARIDVLVAPSLWPESYGLVTREALASGAWVVASDRGAVGSDVTEGVNGHIVDVSDYEPLMEVLARIDADPEKYRNPPEIAPVLRRAEDQARELAGVYSACIVQPKKS
jgi:glycosyltransferase involved in cell wall biosynthesis